MRRHANGEGTQIVFRSGSRTETIQPRSASAALVREPKLRSLRLRTWALRCNPIRGGGQRDIAAKQHAPTQEDAYHETHQSHENNFKKPVRKDTRHLRKLCDLMGRYPSLFSCDLCVSWLKISAAKSTAYPKRACSGTPLVWHRVFSARNPSRP